LYRNWIDIPIHELRYDLSMNHADAIPKTGSTFTFESYDCTVDCGLHKLWYKQKSLCIIQITVRSIKLSTNKIPTS